MNNYLDASAVYRRAGWPGPLPLPAGKKWPPPEGFTGWHGGWPSGADSQAWFDDDPTYRATTQLALRMPDGVIGIDVDHYGIKRGNDTLAEAQRRWGDLPAAPVTSARGVGPSGIRFYRVPKGTRLRTVIRFAAVGEQGQPGYRAGLGHIEIIQFHHRYAVAWPSVHPDTADPYLWYGTADGCTPAQTVKLNPLPERWIEELRGADEPGVAEATPEQVQTFSREHLTADGSARVGGVLRVLDDYLSTGMARHDAMVSVACMAAREAAAGCYPAPEVRKQLREAFMAALVQGGK